MIGSMVCLDLVATFRPPQFTNPAIVVATDNSEGQIFSQVIWTLAKTPVN